MRLFLFAGNVHSILTAQKRKLQKQKERKMNMKKRVLIFLMALAMLATLAACGGGGKSPAGTYKLTQINSGGEEMSVKDLADLFGMEIDMTLELKDDKSFTWDMGLWGEGESARGTWKMDGDPLVLSAEGEDLPVTYDGKTIAMDLEGEIFTFEKQ